MCVWELWQKARTTFSFTYKSFSSTQTVSNIHSKKCTNMFATQQSRRVEWNRYEYQSLHLWTNRRFTWTTSKWYSSFDHLIQHFKGREKAAENALKVFLVRLRTGLTYDQIAHSFGISKLTLRRRLKGPLDKHCWMMLLRNISALEISIAMIWLTIIQQWLELFTVEMEMTIRNQLPFGMALMFIATKVSSIICNVRHTVAKNCETCLNQWFVSLQMVTTLMCSAHT